MLKKDLETEVNRLETELSDCRQQRSSETRKVERITSELVSSTSEVNRLTDQLKQIGQSIHTLLEVRYPYVEEREETEISEEKAMLVFLHRLCEDRRSSRLDEGIFNNYR